MRSKKSKRHASAFSIAIVTVHKQETAAHANTICSPPLELLCQLLLMWVISPLSLNIAQFSVFKLTVNMGQTDVWTDRRTAFIVIGLNRNYHAHQFIFSFSS